MVKHLNFYISGQKINVSSYNNSQTLTPPLSGVTLIFEHSPSRASEIGHFGIFSCPREIQLARQFFVRFNLLLFFLIS